MSFERKPGGATRMSAQLDRSAQEPGRRTLTQDLVQMKVKTGEAPGGDRVKVAAADGVSGGAGPLPYLARIQKAFGRHDVSNLRAHTDGAAQEGARAMGAEAYASGSNVAFGGAPDLHTAAHEAAHAVQQRSGLVLAGGVGAVGDVHERHADAVADRVVAGQSAEDLLDRYGGGGSAAPVVQQKIKTAGVYFATWKSIKRKQETLVAAAEKLREEFRVQLEAKGSVLDAERFETVWNKVVGEDTDFDIDHPDGRAELLAELHKRFGASKTSADRYAKTQTGIDVLIGPVTKAHPELEKKPGGRNTMMVKNPMGQAGPRNVATPADRARQTQTHMSTVTHHNYSGQGEESQSSIQKDQLGLVTSTNNEGTNALLGQDVQSREDIADMAARVAVAHGVGDMNKDDAMGNRVLRHALKLLARLEKHVDPKVKITVPGKAASGQDGVHAEIRIYQHDDFDVSTHHMPSGTKVPCAGCYLYFVQEGHAIGVYMGPMWLTEAALSQQLNGTKIGTIEGENGADLKVVAEQIKLQYEAAVAQGGEMSESLVRGGGHTHATNGDSESDLDDEEYEAMKQEALLRSKTPPRSGREPVKGKPAKKEPGAKRGAGKKKEDKQQRPLSAFGFGGSSSKSPYGYPPMSGLPMPSHGYPPMDTSSMGGPPKFHSPSQPQPSGPLTPSPMFGAPSPSLLPQQPSAPSSTHTHTPLPLLPQYAPLSTPLSPSHAQPPALSTPWSPQPSSPQIGAPSSVDPRVLQLISRMLGALDQPPTPLDANMVLGGQLSFMDALAPTGIGNVAVLHNASGAANNCLINSIASALGVGPASLLTLAQIRSACGGEADRFLGRDDVPTILRFLGRAARVVLIETVDAVQDGTAPYDAVVIGGSGPDIYIVNARELHFGWCTPKPGTRVEVGANRATFVPTALSQPNARPSSPLPPLAFGFGRSSPPRRSSSEVDDDFGRRRSPGSNGKLSSQPGGSSLRRAQSETVDHLGGRQSLAKRKPTESPPTRAVSDLNTRPDKMQRGFGMRGGLARAASMRGGTASSKRSFEGDFSLEEEDMEADIDIDIDIAPEPKRQDRKREDDEDGGGSSGGFFGSSQ